MGRLTLVEGSKSAADALKNGKTIVDFLTSPFSPCAVYNSRGDLMAVNHGNVPSADRFRSLFWAAMEHPSSSVYSVEYMSGEKIVLDFTRAWMPPPKPADAEVVVSQAGAARLCYDGSENLIADEFRQRDYRIGGPDSAMFGVLSRKAKENLEARADEIAAFYQGLRAEGE